MPAAEQRSRDAASLAPPPLTGSQMIKLAALTLAYDVRDRRQDPALRKRPLARALDPRLRQPVFVVGAPRSGTTFLGSCVGRVPEFSYHFEPRFTKAAAGCVYDGSWSEQRAARVFRMSYSVLMLASLHGGRRFAEKTPENSFVIPFLARTLPDARFIHIIRDGRDSAVSHAAKPWLAAASAGRKRRSGPVRGPYPRWWVEPERRAEFVAVSDITRAAWAWRRFTEAALDGLATLPAERVLEVRYESVVSGPMSAAGQIGEFLQVSEPGQQALRSGLAGARPGSVGRWRAELDAHDLPDVDREIAPLLVRLGYA
jgi:hypothetical protein